MNGHGEENRGQIVEVWAHNLEEEIERIRDVVERYQYIALDTEFPGIVARPTANVTDYNYRTVKYNVDLLKVIQLGITFADSKGCLAEGTSTWQFNFRFDLNEDMYAQNSIDFLKQSGIDFDKQQKKGVEVQDFGELIMNSGLVMNEEVKWISFHGCYDFGYLLKLLTCEALPESETAFFELLQDFFPSLYDIKYLLREIPSFNLSGGSSLQKVSEQLQVTRIGPQHQAGSDSLVTCHTFFKLVEAHFENKIDEAKFSGIIYGLGMTAPKHLRPASVPVQSHNCGDVSMLAPNLDGAQAQKLQDQQPHTANGCHNSVLSGGGSGVPSGQRHLSAGPGRVLQPQQQPQQQQQQQPQGGVNWGGVGGGLVGPGGLSMRPQLQGVLGLPGGLGDNTNSLGGEAISRLRGVPPHATSGPGGPRGFASELHRTGSAPPAPLLCGTGENRLWTAPQGGVMVVASSATAAPGRVEGQSGQGECSGFLFDGGAAPGVHSVGGAGNAPPPPP